MLLELIPIGTLLAIITTQVLETALAAQDVLIEKESFCMLAKYIKDIQPVLDELRQRELKESPAVRTALESLQDDLKKAGTLISNCTTKPKMYLLIRCRSIVSDAQQIIRDLAKSLQLMALASAEVSVDISMNVNRLMEKMMNAEFQASESKLVVIRKLERGLREHRTDQGFANDLITDIAKAVGIPVNASEMSKELASFKKQKDEAALRKEREEEAFMEQVITLLSRADAAHLLPETSRSYSRVERSDIISTEPIPPLKSFKCPLKQDVMVDPVSLVTGSCFERSFITKWFEAGNTTDPSTHEELEDMSIRPNIPVRQSIEEWQERNYCIGILNAKGMLQSGDESKQRTALEDISVLCNKSKVNQDWIATEGLVNDIVRALRSSSPDLKRASLSALHILVKGNAANKELLEDAGGVGQVVRCLGRDMSVAKAAAALLLEILDGNDRLISARIGQERSAILLLVTLFKGKDEEAAQLAGLILDKLSNLMENIVQMAAVNWCTPLITRLCEPQEDSCKVIIVNALGTLKLTDDSKMSLAEQGAIVPLVNMLDSRKSEVKLAALSALQNLSAHRQVKGYIAEAGAMPIILNHLFSGMSPIRVREAAAAILANVAASDGATFFVGGDGVSIDEAQVVENLLAVQENSTNHPVIQAHILRTILGFVSPLDAERVRETTRTLNGISMLLPLIGRPDRDVRDSVIQILYHLSDKGWPQIAVYLLKHQKLRSVLKLLNSNMHEDVQVAAAGILASFPGDAALTSALIEADAVSVLITALQAGTPKVKEAAMGALVRFTDSADIEMQRVVAHRNIHPLLIRLIQTGTNICKARAAIALRNFSLTTPSLSLEPDFVCHCFSTSRVPKCVVHQGKCGVKTTFCIVEADAVPGLVNLINDDRGTAAEAGLEALQTLVSEDGILQSGAQFLHDINAINPILDTLTLGTPGLKEKAVKLFERILMAKGMKEAYGLKSRLPLVELASSGSSSVKKQAAKVLAQLEFIDEISTYY